MNIQECIDNYYTENYVNNIKEDLFENGALYKVVDANGNILNRECRIKRINDYFNNLIGTGYKLYAYTIELRPRQFLLAWK